jgi:putative glycosyltransferase (TIGR04372 family)
MDVFLCAEARFFVGTSSGLTHVANLFGTPCALVNWCSTTLPCFPTDLFIPKMVLSKPLKRPLSFSEQFSEPYVSQLDTKLAEFGFAPQDNSPDEILELVKEMFETLETTVSYHQDDLYLQHRAQQSFETPFTSWSGCRVGRDFLRRHPELVSPQRELRML